jgi:hypothetical protein
MVYRYFKKVIYGRIQTLDNGNQIGIGKKIVRVRNTERSAGNIPPEFRKKYSISQKKKRNDKLTKKFTL